MTSHAQDAATHAADIAYQFTAQAASFAAAPELHSEAALAAMVNAAQATANDLSLDVACGPGTVAAAFARHVNRAHGIDATPAMLEQAQALTAHEQLTNITWHQGDATALPFTDDCFDIVTCRFAFHHMLSPASVFAEMVRVTKPGGRVVLSDAVCSDDSVKATAFNAMERFRDPSTVEFRTFGFLKALFAQHGLPEPALTTFRVPYEATQFVARSFPANDDRAGLLKVLEDSVDGDTLGMGSRRENGKVFLAFNAVILAATKPA